jgi:hypothetical protein
LANQGSPRNLNIAELMIPLHSAFYQSNPMKPTGLLLRCLALALFLILPTLAEEGKPVVPKHGAIAIYRIAQVEEAKKRAIAEDKPIAWIGSRDEYLAPVRNLRAKGSHAMTQYAIRALQNDCIIGFNDGFREAHQEPPIVERALREPVVHYMAPGIIIVTPSMDKVITKAFYIEDPQERVRVFTEMLKTIRDKSSWKTNSAPKETTPKP